MGGGRRVGNVGRECENRLPAAVFKFHDMPQNLVYMRSVEFRVTCVVVYKAL